MSKIKIEYIDSSGLSEKEIVAQMRHIFGGEAYIETAPDTNDPKTCIKYAIKNLITDRQAVSFFDDPKRVYGIRKQEFEREILEFCANILDDVLMENEDKWT